VGPRLVWEAFRGVPPDPGGDDDIAEQGGSADGVVNLVRSSAAGMIGGLISVGEGLG
jgi:hypothetical protein